MKYSAIIVAAGKGSRSGLSINKVYSLLAQRRVLEYSLELFLSDPDCCQVVCVVNIEEFNKYFPMKYDQKIVLAQGGTTRQQSVLNGMAAVTQDVVMIHDGARPYVSVDIIQRCKEVLAHHEAACVCMPCVDTIKQGNGRIETTLDRSLLYVAQTPQCFHSDNYFKHACLAMRQNVSVTDDCSIMEWAGCDDIAIVQGSSLNVKLTWPDDFNPKNKR